MNRARRSHSRLPTSDFRPRRRGLTLIELVMTIGIGSVVFGLTVTLLASILRTERTARQHLAETQTIGRLAHQFRRDAHAAASAELAPAANSGPATLRLAMQDGSQVDYQWAEGGLRRTWSPANRSPSREVFVLPSAAAASFELDHAPSAQFAILRLESRPSDPHGRAGRKLRIEAKIGSISPSPGTPGEGGVRGSGRGKAL